MEKKIKQEKKIFYFLFFVNDRNRERKMDKDSVLDNIIANDKYKNYNQLQTTFIKRLPILLYLLHEYTNNISNNQFKEYDIDQSWYEDLCTNFLSEYKNKEYNNKNLSMMEHNFMQIEQEKIRASYQSYLNHQKKLESRKRVLPPRPTIECKNAFDNKNMMAPKSNIVPEAQRQRFLTIVNRTQQNNF